MRLQADGKLIGDVVRSTADTGRRSAVFLEDQVGSIVAKIVNTGELKTRAPRDPFGNTMNTGSNPQPGDYPFLGSEPDNASPDVASGPTSLLGYAGHERDPWGVIDMKSRLYSPKLGRFLTPDSILPDPFDSRDHNPFTYVHNHPDSAWDPDGHTEGDPPSCFGWCGGDGSGGGGGGGGGATANPPPKQHGSSGHTRANRGPTPVNVAAASAPSSSANASKSPLPAWLDRFMDSKFDDGLSRGISYNFENWTCHGWAECIGQGLGMAGRNWEHTVPAGMARGMGRLRAPASTPVVVENIPPENTTQAGAGGYWPVGRETPGGAVGQLTPVSCGAACGEMVAGIPQETLIEAAGAPTSAGILGSKICMRGGYVPPSALPELQRLPRAWIAELRGDESHFVVVDGMRGKNLFIRDPWKGGSTYEMTIKSFLNAWTGNVVIP